MPNPTRINSIDILRGAVMIIMALDHTRDFFHVQAFTGDPLDLKTTTPALFMTRWITHFCAPIFVFLSGTSAFLQGMRKSKKELSAFLITRGFWLLVAEFLIITLAISFDPAYPTLVFQVIGAIGVSMIVLGLLVWLPFGGILLLAALLFFGHNYLDGWEASMQNKLPAWYLPLHRFTLIPLGPGRQIAVLYPVLPWIGVMAMGYCFGKFYTMTAERRNRNILYVGVALTALFVVLRSANIYGDPRPWVEQSSLLYTFFALVDTQKYPPSLLYCCMTLGPGLIVLSIADKIPSFLSAVLIVFGRVPFFYYILHFYLIHAASMLAFFLRGHSFQKGYYGYPNLPMKFIVPGEGLSLAWVYVVWMVVVVVLYPACKWYGQYKRTHQQWWLSYL